MWHVKSFELKTDDKSPFAGAGDPAAPKDLWPKFVDRGSPRIAVSCVREPTRLSKAPTPTRPP